MLEAEFRTVEGIRCASNVLPVIKGQPSMLNLLPRRLVVTAGLVLSLLLLSGTITTADTARWRVP